MRPVPLYRDVTPDLSRPDFVRFSGVATAAEVGKVAEALAAEPRAGLRIVDAGRSDLGWLRDLPPVQYLEVIMSNITDVRALEAHSGSLRMLHVESGRERLDLSPLSSLGRLEQLYVHAGGQVKPVGVPTVLAALVGLEHLTLHRISLREAGRLDHLVRLRGLALKLGSAVDLAPLAGLPELQFVEAWQVRDLADLSALLTLRKLDVLWLETLARAVVPDLSEAGALSHIRIDKLPMTEGLSPLAAAPVLRQLAITRRLFSIEEVKVLREHQTLHAASIPIRGRGVEITDVLDVGRVHWAPFTAYSAGAMGLPREGWDGRYLVEDEGLGQVAGSRSG